MDAAVPAGRYRLLAPLGAGPDGPVYLAHDPDTGRALDLELMEGDPAALVPVAERFEAEVLARRLLSGANALRAECGSADGRVWLAFPYVAGLPLVHALTGAASTAPWRAAAARDLLDTARAFHAHDLSAGPLGTERLWVSPVGEVIVRGLGRHLAAGLVPAREPAADLPDLVWVFELLLPPDERTAPVHAALAAYGESLQRDSAEPFAALLRAVDALAAPGSDAATAGEPPAGRVLAGRYRLRALTEEDRFGRLYSAADEEAGCDVTVRLLNPELAAPLRGLLALGHRLAHRPDAPLPHVLCPLDLGRDRDLYFVVQPWAPGRPLEDRLREGPLTVARAVDVARRVAEALRELDEQGLHHGELGPWSVWLTPEDGVLLRDFGLNERAFPVHAGEDASEVVERARYGAPEVFTGAELDVRSDIYALGALLFRLLAGRPPFEVGSVRLLALQHLHQEAPSVRALRPELSIPLDALVHACLEKRPAQRYATPLDFLETLAEVPEAEV